MRSAGGVAGEGVGRGCGGTHSCAGEGATDASTRDPGSTVAQLRDNKTGKIEIRSMVADLPSESAIRMKGASHCRPFRRCRSRQSDAPLGRGNAKPVRSPSPRWVKLLPRPAYLPNFRTFASTRSLRTYSGTGAEFFFTEGNRMETSTAPPR